MSLGDRAGETVRSLRSGGWASFVSIFEILIFGAVVRLGWELGGWLLRKF